VFVETPEFASGVLWQRFPKGSSILRLSGTATNSEPKNLTGGFFAAGDPQVNFDGTRILFSGQKNQGEHWQIWEMDLDGANRRQITQCAQDCVRGAYLPGEEIAFTVEELQGKHRQSYLAVAKVDGSMLRRITFGPAEFELETVLRDGRIVASAPWPLTGGKEGTRLLYTLRPDGTALESLRCSHNGAGIQTDAEEMEDGSVVFVARHDSIESAGGELEQIRRGAVGPTPLGTIQRLGTGERQGCQTPRLRSSRLTDAGPGNLPSPQKRGLSSDEGIEYRWPRQVSIEELIVSKERSVTNNAAPKFDLFTFNLRTGTLGQKVYGDERNSSIQPAVVAPHVVPKRYWSTLNPESPDGYFISLDSYLAADVPNGRIATPIAQVRVMTMDAADGKERVLGVAPVENDGSFYVRVPANAPVRFVLLDVKGQTIREERSWVWSRPGEQRGCTGCHGDKAVAPENHWPLTLKRFDTPTALGEIQHGSATAHAN